MKKKYLFILIIKGSFLFSQITIGEIKEIDTIPKNKPLVYNSVDNFKMRDSDNDVDYKMYIGLKFFNPPAPSITEEYIKSKFENRLNESFNERLIGSNYEVFTDSISKIDLEEFVGQKFYYNDKLGNYSKSEEVERDGSPKITVNKLYTVVYNPKPILNAGFIEIINNPEQFNNRYFTLIDVLTDTKFDELVKNIKNKLRLFKNYNNNDFGKDNVYRNKDIYSGVLFKFRDDINKKEFYVSEKYIENFILVPFFVNQKTQYDSKLMINSGWDKQRGWDIRNSFEDYTIKEPNLVYKCEITLLKGNNEFGGPIDKYYLAYRLTNEIGESIIYKNEKQLLDHFEFIDLYKKRINDKKIEIEKQQKIKQNNEINDKSKQKQKEEEYRVEQEKTSKIKNEKELIFRNKMISLYGNKIGSQIADGKVSIGMSKKLCEIAWRNMSHMKKTTILKGKTFEIWTSYFDNRLYFENDALIRIDK